MQVRHRLIETRQFAKWLLHKTAHVLETFVIGGETAFFINRKVNNLTRNKYN